MAGYVDRPSRQTAGRDRGDTAADRSAACAAATAWRETLGKAGICGAIGPGKSLIAGVSVFTWYHSHLSVPGAH
jgi:hypothetical protein